MSPNFTNTAQQIAYRKVADYLATSELLKSSFRPVEDQASFHILYGSTMVEVDILPWEFHPWEPQDLAIVRASSCVTIGSCIDFDLMQYLLGENRRMRFGGFHLDDAGQVVFSYSILGGENMDLMELQSCILSVVTIADTYDDIITQRFGGKRAADQVSSESLR
ncbi:MAG TPA: hypothetical protein IGS37_19670 [Synechococcales cyanobacterium M55_K2018_004]|nr:hypothetical protein [Synechococcales cyanobacterium M55_K2018_004]